MAIPIALTGTDVIAQARTGTGKTLAFGIPLLQRIIAPDDRDYADLDAPGKPQALVVAPTRELASQVADDLIRAGTRREVRILTVYGGVAYEPQLEALDRGVDVVVGTPGRLLDLVDKRHLALGHVKALVLDEADRMLDLGFLPDVERLISLTHEMRQTMLFSATMPSDIVQLARRHMRHPINVRAEAAEESQTVPATAQFVYRAHSLDKPELLARILQADDRGRSIVFCTTKRSAQRVADDLVERGFAAAAIHGDLGQVAREKALERFRSGKVDVLVATDVAARGIDVEGVTHVINHTCPEDEKTYLHRIGRTGRAGATGSAVTLVDWSDLARWKMINTALDLPFAEPPETYSTSDHLYTELGVSKEVSGRLSGARPQPKRSSDDEPSRERRARSERGGRERTRRRRRTRGGEEAAAERTGEATTDGANGAEAGETATRPRRRRRLRSGVPVDTATEASGDSPSGGADATGEDSAERPRRRRRRRTRGGSSGEPASPNDNGASDGSGASGEASQD